MTTSSGDQSGFENRTQPPSGPPAAAKPATRTPRPAAGASPRKRSRHARNRFVIFLNVILSSVVLLVLAAAVAFVVGKAIFEAPGPSRTTERVMFEPNTGVRTIAERLETEGLISDSRVFLLGVRAYGKDDELKAGEYEIEADASMHDIMDLLESGRSVLYSLTVPEGLTVEQAWERIARTEQLSGELPDERPPEGGLAADTLRFTRGTDRGSIVEQLRAQQESLVEGIWKDRDEGLPIDSIEEFVTLASIVEKETGQPEERARVAAVFLNRLERGMRLQSDPTVIYGLFGGAGKPADRPLYRSDLEKETPYNTYVIDGLPPTPIANPGRAALKAVANPADTAELYFVADGTGGHAFASTLEEHNENVARWREIERRDREDAADGEVVTEGEAGAEREGED